MPASHQFGACPFLHKLFYRLVSPFIHSLVSIACVGQTYIRSCTHTATEPHILVRIPFSKQSCCLFHEMRCHDARTARTPTIYPCRFQSAQSVGTCTFAPWKYGSSIITAFCSYILLYENREVFKQNLISAKNKENILHILSV